MDQVLIRLEEVPQDLLEDWKMPLMLGKISKEVEIQEIQADKEAQGMLWKYLQMDKHERWRF